MPSNIAEGHAHRGRRTFLRHVRIALGSHAELDTQLELALRLKLIAETDVGSLAAAISRTGQLLHGLERSLKQRLQRGARI